MGLFGAVTRAIGHEVRLVRGAIHRRLYLPREVERDIVQQFHRLFFDARAFNMSWRATRWLGRPVLKCPMDLWLYQEMLHEVRPDVIVETGTAYGGSALFLASICDLLQHGRVITIDLEPQPDLPAHPRVEYWTGSSVDPAMVDRVRAATAGAARVMVLLDSDHRKAHVLEELRAYAPLVTPDSYLVVEDTNLNGNPVEPHFGEGPMEALQEFLAARSDFVVDRTKEKLFLTFNPNGYLKRVAVLLVGVIALG